ncbi:MAG: hypothetical protein ABEK50_13450 [bacterium]
MGSVVITVVFFIACIVFGAVIFKGFGNFAFSDTVDSETWKQFARNCDLEFKELKEQFSEEQKQELENSEFAQSLIENMSDARPVLEGEYSGHPAKIWTFTRGGSTGSTTHSSRELYTAFRLEHDLDLPEGLELEKEGTFDKLTQFVTGGDIQIGEQAFDSEVEVTADSKQDARSFLTKKRAETIQEFLRNHEDGRLTSSEIYTQYRGFVDEPDQLEQTLNELKSILKTLKSPR